MRSPLKALLITGSLAAAILGATLPAVATAAPAGANPKPAPSPSPTPSPSPSSAAPTLDTSHFACSNGVCEMGPSNVGMSFAAGLYATAPNSPTFLITVVSGSLPPGLQLASQNGDPWTITGTPTKAGTYAFTVQITASNTNGPYGPSATQQLTITIGTGSSDRPAGIGAGWNIHTETLGLGGWDANISALWSVSVTSTGRVLFSNLPSRTTYPIDGFLVVQIHSGYPCPFGGCDLTVTNSLGSSVTVFLGPPKY
jgi:Putative Ig domain